MWSESERLMARIHVERLVSFNTMGVDHLMSDLNHQQHTPEETPCPTEKLFNGPMAPPQPSQGGPKPCIINISYIETLNPIETMHNQLLAIFMRASPILANMAKNKDSDVHTSRLAEYFDSSAMPIGQSCFPNPAIS